MPTTWMTDLSKSERAKLLTFELGEEHYRRSEDRWTDAGSPRATIAVGAEDAELVVYAHVEAGERHFARAGASNAFDNEHADTMAAGIQLYVRMPDGSLAESSAELVAWAVELAHACGREPMTPAEVRELLGRDGFTPGRVPDWA